MGEVYLSSLEGNRQWLDGGAMFGNVPRAVWSGWCQPDGRGRIELACRSLLVEYGTQKILFEAGIGAFFEPKLADRYGVTETRHTLLESLAAIGVKQEDITVVVLSHLHFDHAGGLLPAYGSGSEALLFPHAEYWVGEVAWERATHPHPRDRASFVPQVIQGLAACNRLRVLPKGSAVAPSPLAAILGFHYTDGHTPGQMHAVLQSGNSAKVFFAGDLIPGCHWIHVPVTMGYDRFAEQVIDEKSSILPRAVSEDWVLFFTHDPTFAASRVIRDEKGRYAAAHPVPAWKRLPMSDLPA